MAHSLPDFTPRPQQQRMALAVAQALEQQQQLVVEAGTGTGKTLAYLIPPLLAGAKVVISTASHTLQSQLYDQVLPFLRGKAGLPIQAVQLKGRSNYLCLHRLQGQMLQQATRQHHELPRLQALQRWAKQTHTGDLAEVGDIRDGDRFWARVSSTVENCLGRDCPQLGECHLVKARAAAMEAELVIVNHHILLADYALRDQGFSALLPGADMVIVDEAHHLPEIANQFFGQRVSSHQMASCLRDLNEEVKRSLSDMPALKTLQQQANAELASVMQCLLSQTQRVSRAQLLAQQPGSQGVLEALQQAWQALASALGAVASRSKDIDKLAERYATQCESLQQWLQADASHIAWIDCQSKRFDLHLTPQVLTEQLQAVWSAAKVAWVFTSATLAVGSNFDYFTQRMGLEADACVQMDSPFAYAEQALLYLPTHMPLPSDAGYLDAVLQQAIPLIRAAQGGVFLLCTSMRAVRYLHERLQGSFEYTLLAQGDAARGELLQRFREDGNAILVATQSFWEGVDVRGRALRLVIIDKLPFATPDDPVLKARSEYLRQQGGNPFTQLQLPAAVLALKQGAGRLIRDAGDRGVLMVADPRLQSARYAKAFLNSLPAMERCHNLQQACDFVAAAAAQEAAA